ncbi:transcriptional regulator [Terasakiella sp. SH-1]|uniref:transcriptional regulator n=1 Tax=Terasakiella sp. SH-1 TaxID=2560057 RepID=UPI0010735EE8|nr:transcriptional regulator [Terasakiella sp. SH-1]
MAHTVHRIDVTKDEVFDDLQKLAGLSHTSVDEYATTILAEYVSVQKWQIEQIQQAKIEADQGGPFIANEDMASWVNSWGTKNELPAPKATIYTK